MKDFHPQSLPPLLSFFHRRFMCAMHTHRMRCGFLIVPHNIPKAAVKREFLAFYKVELSLDNPDEFAELDESPDSKAKVVESKPHVPRATSMSDDKASVMHRDVRASNVLIDVNERSWAPKQPAPSAYTTISGPVATQSAAYSNKGKNDFFQGAILSSCPHSFLFCFVTECVFVVVVKVCVFE